MPIRGLPGGDFEGCVSEMRGKVNNPEAFCAWKTHQLSGKWPAEEAIKRCTTEAEAEFKRRQYNGVEYSATDKRPSSRDDKKYMRVVRFGGEEKVVHWGEPGKQMERDNPPRRKAFEDRHGCAKKMDPFSPGFQACYDWQPGAESVTVEEAALSETFPASLSVREGKTSNTVLLDGILIVEGVSGNGNDYTLEALRSAPAIFADKPIRINHPSRSDDRDRPEGDLYTQVGRLPSEDGFTVVQRQDGLHEVRFSGAVLSASPPDVWIADRIRAGIIGDMSINGGGEGVREAGGKFTVSKFTAATSHDLVTVAAAGGKAVALHESGKGETMSKRQKRAIKAMVDRVMESTKLPSEFRALVESEAIRLIEQADEDEEETKTAREMDEDEDKKIAQEIDDEEDKTRLIISQEQNDEEMEGEESAPGFLANLPSNVQDKWIKTFNACMGTSGSSETACVHQAWYSVVRSRAGTHEQEDGDSLDGKDDKMQEALNHYAKTLKAALAKMPRVGQVQGMGAGNRPVRESEPESDYEERLVEAFSRIPGFTPDMAATAAKGR
jgi:hypothetical protein